MIWSHMYWTYRVIVKWAAKFYQLAKPEIELPFFYQNWGDEPGITTRKENQAMLALSVLTGDPGGKVKGLPGNSGYHDRWQGR